MHDFENSPFHYNVFYTLIECIFDQLLEMQKKAFRKLHRHQADDKFISKFYNTPSHKKMLRLSD